ncbi:MAG: hypothetical protein P8Z00_15595 [Anaerolineales bacterium]|jgi:hypothetical protein
MKKSLVIMAAMGVALLLVVGSILLAGTVSSAQAAAGTHTWTGAVDQNWSNPANWSPATTPVYTDGMDCLLPAGAPRYPAVEFDTLDCGGVVRIESGARLDTSNVDFSMTDAQISGTWRLNGYVDLHGSHHKMVVSPGGLLYFDGLDGGSGDSNTGTPPLDQNAFLISGTLRISGTATIYRDTNLFVGPSGLVDLQPGADLSIDDNGQLVNHGTLQQTNVVNGATSFFMVNGMPSGGAPGNSTLKYAGVTITPTAGSLSTTTVRLKGDQTCAPGAVERCYEIQPTNPVSATLRFYYLGGEANGNTAPNVYVLNGTQYDALPSVQGSNGGQLYAQGDGGSQYGHFVLKDSQPAPQVRLYLPALYRK